MPNGARPPGCGLQCPPSRASVVHRQLLLLCHASPPPGEAAPRPPPPAPPSVSIHTCAPPRLGRIKAPGANPGRKSPRAESRESGSLPAWRKVISNVCEEGASGGTPAWSWSISTSCRAAGTERGPAPPPPRAWKEALLAPRERQRTALPRLI